ncbi:MAG: flagellar protein export ATPase FliI [Candidatus Riflebacteria bacterium]|nr:flagellar protein export ATPase FliI [Candidatus Riflebacteria bacterium]
MSFPFEKYQNALAKAETIRLSGKVTQVVGLIVEATGPQMSVGEVGRISTPNGFLPCEVVGFRRGAVLMMPLIQTEGIRQGSEVIPLGRQLTAPAGDRLLGRILDGLGEPIDEKGPLPDGLARVPINRDPPSPFSRKRISSILGTGVKVIDTLLTLGRGQRIGIFAGSGVGKSTLMGMISRSSQADVNVIGLVGERGREVREFIEKDLGVEGLKRSVVVVATSDRPALVRIKAAYTATAIAEYFRDQGKNVILMMDSVTRFALAQREVGLAVGEPPTTRGYTPSVFSLLPRLLERAGTSSHGTITGIYTVLVEGGDMDEPVADAVRGILDGHFVLTRELAQQNVYPAIDILQSISRLMPDICTKRHMDAANRIRDLYATYQQAADLINIGAYKAGTNPKIDEAVQKMPKITEFIKQGIKEAVPAEVSMKAIEGLV